MLGTAFDTRPNAFNALRLALASTVIVWHAVLFGSADIYQDRPVWQGLEDFAVDGFFVISGFLIVRSWDRRPDAVAFVRARLGRLLPGLWLCLAVTAFVIAPLVAGPPFGLVDQVRYVLGNAGVLVTQLGIKDPMPYTNGWNISLWSLWWELLCYAAVLVLGKAGVLRGSVVRVVAVFFWAWMAVITLTGQWLSLPGTVWMVALPRLGFMFALGALAYFHRDRIPLRGSYAAAAAVVLTVSVFTPNYHLLGAPALAYLVLWAGVELGRHPRLRLETDLSYGVYVYGSPVLVALTLSGLTSWWLLALVAYAVVLPLAALSWFLVERPALRWARGRRAARLQPSPVPMQEMA